MELLLMVKIKRKIYNGRKYINKNNYTKTEKSKKNSFNENLLLKERYKVENLFAILKKMFI